MQKDFMVQQRRQRQLSSKLSETQFNMEKNERESQKARLVLLDMDKIDKSANVFGQVEVLYWNSLTRGETSTHRSVIRR